MPLQRSETGFTLVHGSPRDPTWEYITSAPVARANLALLQTPYGLFGHTHLPVVYRDDRGLIETLSPMSGSAVRLDERPTLLNPGSVGQPRDGDPRASYLILDIERGEGHWGRVDYGHRGGTGGDAGCEASGAPDRATGPRAVTGPGRTASSASSSPSTASTVRPTGRPTAVPTATARPTTVVVTTEKHTSPILERLLKADHSSLRAHSWSVLILGP